jgi:uncharacterized protein YjiS (DUF1127 family)
MTVAADNVLAVSPDVVLAAHVPLDNTAAGSPDTATRLILTILARYWRSWREWRQRQRLRIALHELSERELTDIGLARADIEYITAHRALDRLKSDTTLWTRSGA